jgi:hypothetical protein
MALVYVPVLWMLSGNEPVAALVALCWLILRSRGRCREDDGGGRRRTSRSRTWLEP